MTGHGVRRWRRHVVTILVTALFAGGQTIAVTAPAHADHGGVDSFQEGVGPDVTRYGIYWKWRAGVSATCAHDGLGDGWNCTPYRPNTIDYAFWASGGVNNVEQAVAQIFSNWSPFPGDHYWRQSANVDCFSTSYCSYPDNSCSVGFAPSPGYCYRHFEDYEGGYFSSSLTYLYQPNPFTCGTNCSTRWYETPRYSLVNLPYITTHVANRHPTTTLVTPNGGSYYGAGPVRQQVFVISANDPDGHNWTGEVEVYAPNGALVIRDTLGGQKFKSGQAATTIPVALPAQSGTYTWRARAIDTSGTGTAAGPWSHGSFAYTVL